MEDKNIVESSEFITDGAGNPVNAEFQCYATNCGPQDYDFMLEHALEDKVKNSPYVCPICSGIGYVPYGFYSRSINTWSSTVSNFDTCRSCLGTGIVWK